MPAELRWLLTAAAVQGEQFTAEVVAHVLGRSAAEVIHLLSAELGRRHRLTLAVGVERSGELQLAHYRFRHVLFCHYLLNHLDAAEQAHLHAATAAALEAICACAPDELAARAVQLAWHHRLAGHDAQAGPYYVQAGYRSLRLGAHGDAERLFQAGLDLVPPSTADATHSENELDLLIGLSTSLAASRGYPSVEVAAIGRRALPLCRKTSRPAQHFQVLWQLWHHHYHRGEYGEARDLAQQCVDLAQGIRLYEAKYRLAAAAALGPTLYRLGEFEAASRCMSAVLPLVRDASPADLAIRIGPEPGVNCLVNEAVARWYLGKPEQSGQLMQEALARARQIDQPYSLAFAMLFAVGLAQKGNDVAATAVAATAGIEQFRSWGITFFTAVGALLHGWALAAQGDCDAGLAEAEAGLADMHAMGMEYIRYSALLADAVCPLRALRRRASSGRSVARAGRANRGTRT